MFVRPDAATWRAEALPQTSAMSVMIYLSDERIHEDVEAAVKEFLATAGLRICDREDPVTELWFRRMAPTVKAAVNSPLSREALATAAHAADARLVLAQDAVVTATLMQNLAPVLGALHPTKDAVIRAGALLVVKMNWTVSVIQLTAAQQLHLDHHPELVRCPAEIAAASTSSHPTASATARRAHSDRPCMEPDGLGHTLPDKPLTCRASSYS